MDQELQAILMNFAQAIEQISNNQVGMELSINNLKYEIAGSLQKIQLPVVLDGSLAIEKIIKEGKSICRFGDGEFDTIFGRRRQAFQEPNQELGRRLLEVLHSKNENVLVCIADNYGDLSKYNADSTYRIRQYMTKETRELHNKVLESGRVYYDAYLSRPYVLMEDNQTDAPRKRFEQLQKIWDGRKVLMIEGEQTRMGVGNDLFVNAKEIKRILAPSVNAFNSYSEILKVAKEQDKETLVLIALGATATVLAYDLAVEGFQAIDIGHVDLEYEWMLQGKGQRTAVHGKYNNEIDGGNIVEDISDDIYESQIIAIIK